MAVIISPVAGPLTCSFGAGMRDIIRENSGETSCFLDIGQFELREGVMEIVGPGGKVIVSLAILSQQGNQRLRQGVPPIHGIVTRTDFEVMHRIISGPQYVAEMTVHHEH